MEKKKVLVLPLNSLSFPGGQLCRYFLAASVLDNGGSMSVSRRAMSDLLAMYEDPDSFQLVVQPAGGDQDLKISLLPVE